MYAIAMRRSKNGIIDDTTDDNIRYLTVNERFAAFFRDRVKATLFTLDEALHFKSRLDGAFITEID